MADHVNIEEIKEKLEEIFGESSRYGFDFVDFLTGDYDEEAAEAGKVVWISQDGGGEGGAESCETIFSIDGVIYRVTYSYYSHHGFETEYAQASVVTPKEKTIIVYE